MAEQQNRIDIVSGIALLCLSLFTLANYVDLLYWFPNGYKNFPNLFGTFLGLSVIFGWLVSPLHRISDNLCIENACLIAILLLAMYSNMAFTIDHNHSHKIFSDFWKSILIFFLIFNSIRTFKTFKIYFHILVLGGFYMAYMLTHYPMYTGGRAFTPGSTLAGDPNDVSMVMVYSISFLAILFITHKNNVVRLGMIYILYIMLLSFIEANSRGGLLALSAACFMFVFEVKGLQKKILLSVLLLAFLGLFFYRYSPDMFVDRMYELTDPMGKDKTGSANIRFLNMSISFSYMTDHLMSYYGLGNNGYLIAKELGMMVTEDVFHGNHVHNSFLEIGVDLGLICFILFSVFHLSIIRKLSKSISALEGFEDPESKEMKWYLKGLRIGLIGYIVASFFLPVAYRLYLYYISGVCMVGIKLSELKRQK